MAPTDVRNPAQVDLWYVFLDKTTDPQLQNAYRALLSPEESQREQRFVVEHARLQFLVSRALLRTVLRTTRDVIRASLRSGAIRTASLP